MADNSSSARAANIRALGQNTNTRNRIFIVGLVVLAMVVFGALVLFSPSKKAQQGPSSVSVAPPPNIKSVAGTSQSGTYTHLVQDTNEKQFEQNQAKGNASLPTLTGTANQGVGDPFALVQPVNPKQPSAIAQQAVTPQPIQALPTGNQVSNNGAADASHARSNAQEQFDLYVTSWKFKPSTDEFNYYGQRPKDSTTGGASGGAGGGSTSATGTAGAATASAASTDATTGPTFVRAGTVMPAVLITPINSDTPGPILAEITSGPLAGARLLGTFSASDKQVVVKFSTLSMVGQPKSFTIQAYAVDQNTSAPGLATDVNNHYLKKYGLLAAAAFVGGYGQAIETQGTTTVISPLGGATVSQGQLSNSQISKAALGNVGDRLASQIQQDSSQTRPTIKVEGAHGQGGVPIGVMFMSDF
jgi:intracellular multiplication protein IcmE